jgi:hypothetical protein
MKTPDPCARTLGILLLAGLLIGPFSAIAVAQAQTQTAQASDPQKEPVMLFNGLVRDARIAQRNCDIGAKRAAVNAIQRAIRSVSVHLRRTARAIRRGTDQLKNDGLDLTDLRQARSAQDALEVIHETLNSTTNNTQKVRLSALRDRYTEFDQWEVFYGKATRMLARLDGAPGKCETKPVERPTVECSPDEFEACRYGGPAVGYPRDMRLAIPIRKK